MSALSFLTQSISEGASLRSCINASLNAICPVEDLEGGVRVTTHCIYPSNSLVRVIVNGGMESIVVSDDGEALGEALAAGIEIENADKLLRGFVQQRGLIISDGVIRSPVTSMDAAPVAILHVANVAKEAALWLYERGGLTRRSDFRELLSGFLMMEFKEQFAETRIPGASQKPHLFANVISFPNGRRFIVDAVSNDASSINARLVANMDVKATNDPSIDQRIVYDDAQPWSVADLNLLKLGATIVPFSQAQAVIQRIAKELRIAT